MIPWTGISRDWTAGLHTLLGALGPLIGYFYLNVLFQLHLTWFSIGLLTWAFFTGFEWKNGLWWNLNPPIGTSEFFGVLDFWGMTIGVITLLNTLILLGIDIGLPLPPIIITNFAGMSQEMAIALVRTPGWSVSFTTLVLIGLAGTLYAALHLVNLILDRRFIDRDREEVQLKTGDIKSKLDAYLEKTGS